MGKLLGHQIKRHFKSNWFILILPIIFGVTGLAFNTININWGGTIFGLCITSVIFGYIAAAITVVVGDYNMFFGDSALFYESIPVSPWAKTFSRVLYYFIMFLIYSIYMGLLFFVLESIALDSSPSNFQGFNWNSFIEELNKVGLKNILIALSWGIIILIRSISKIIFAINYGSVKKMGRFGSGGSVLVYIALSIGEGIILHLLDKSNVMTNIQLYLGNGGVFIKMGYASLILIAIEAALFIYGTYYSHKNKISVS